MQPANAEGGERLRALAPFAAAATSLLMVAQQVAGKAARDSLFLSSFEASSLPAVMAAGAALSFVAISWLQRLLERSSPATITPVIFAASALGLALEWAVGFVSPPISAASVYLHTALFGPAVISAFWSMIHERFDPHTAKRIAPRIAAGGTLGGVLGGLAAWGASPVIDPRTLLLLLAALNAACAAGAIFVRGNESAPRASSEAKAARSAYGGLLRAPLLRDLAILVTVVSALSALLDFLFCTHAAAAFDAGQPLLRFFSFFWLCVSLISFLLQLALGRIALEKLGLAANLAVLPAVLIAGGAFGLIVPGLISSTILRALEAIQRNTLFRSAYELLFAPLPEVDKRSTKGLIDIGFDRLGTLLGSGSILALLWLAPGATFVLNAAVVALSVATLLVIRSVHRSYLTALEGGLREGATVLGLPAAARSEIQPKEEAIARDELIGRVEELHPGGLAGFGEADRTGAEKAAVETAAPGKSAEALIAQIRDLVSGDPARARRVLSAFPAEGTPLVTFAIELLADTRLYFEAQETLRRVAPRVIGQLVDALLDPAARFDIRRRLPRVLAVCSSQRAVDGLVVGLGADRFEIRYECGRALLRITDRSPELSIPRELVIEAIKREAVAELPQSPELDDDPEEPKQDLLSLLVHDRFDRRLRHVFTILSLHLDRELLRIAFQALHQQDLRHRGTALELLATILPSEVREVVWPLLGEEAPLRGGRASEDILAELIRLTSPAP
jgi:ATP:ADP antiporter, AAA family